MSVKLSRLELAALLGMGLPVAAQEAPQDVLQEPTQSPSAPLLAPEATPEPAPRVAASAEASHTSPAALREGLCETAAAQGRRTKRTGDGATPARHEASEPLPAVALPGTPRVAATEGFHDERHASAYLKKVLAGLWHKVEAERLTRPEQRERLLHLLQWAAGKNGWVMQTAVAQRYADVGRQVEGRLWVTLSLDAQMRFALELAFEARQAPLAKLHAARHAGFVPLLLMPGARPLAERMDELHRVFGAERLTWLQVQALTRPA